MFKHKKVAKSKVQLCRSKTIKIKNTDPIRSPLKNDFFVDGIFDGKNMGKMTSCDNRKEK